MFLEALIPPPVVAGLIGLAMFFLAPWTGLLAIHRAIYLTISAGFAFIGIGVIIGALIPFWRQGTTINPHTPQKTTRLITQGIYRWSRNPMYLGMLCGLIAWAFFLSSPPLLLGALIFMGYLNRFQIAPEEKHLTAIFGDDYRAYQQSTRRWI